MKFFWNKLKVFQVSVNIAVKQNIFPMKTKRLSLYFLKTNKQKAPYEPSWVIMWENYQ